MKLSTKTIHRLRKDVTGYMFVMPLILGIIIFSIVPIVNSFWYSLHNFNGFNKFEYIGLRNYQQLFQHDTEIGKVMGNTLFYAVLSIVFNLSLSYLLALSVNKQSAGVYVVRVLFYIPCVIPGVVMSAMWTDLLSTSGAFNSILTSLGMKPFSFLNAAETSMATLFMLNLWGLGGGMILWLAAFKNIPKTLYEAAEIDGAKKFTCFYTITIPMSTPTIFYNLITGIIGALQNNGTLMLAPLKGKGYGNSVYFMAVKIHIDAFQRFKFGYACAEAWLLFAVIGVLVAIMFKTSKWVFYDDE